MALLSGETPNLRSLTVGPRPLSFGLNVVSLNEPVQLDRTTCQLHELVVHCCSLSGFTFTFTFPHLRHLGLIDVLPQGPSVDQVVAVLAGCAGTLETLVLVGCAIRPCHERLDQEKRLSMSKLRKFIIRGVNEASVAQILDSIELPSSTETLVYTTDRELVGSRVLGHVVSLTTKIAKLGQGRVLRIASVCSDIRFEFGNVTLGIQFHRANRLLPSSSEFNETLRTVLQGSFGQALRQYRPWLHFYRSPEDYPCVGYCLKPILEICHSSFPKTHGLIIDGADANVIVSSLGRPIKTVSGPLWLFPRLQLVWLLRTDNFDWLEVCFGLVDSRRRTNLAESIIGLWLPKKTEARKLASLRRIVSNVLVR